MKKLLIIFILFVSLPVSAKHLHLESYYQEKYCTGVMEYRLDNGLRVDCLLPNYAVEYDFAKKYRQSILQALEYAMHTNKHAKCVLIKESEKDQKYIDRANELIRFYGLPLVVEVVSD